MTTLQIANICHEANRLYCEMLGDYSQPTWNEAPDWQRQSAIDGVRNCLLSEFPVSPAQSHENWLKLKEAEGWKYGETKQPLLKEHPCFLPYDELPAEQKIKDSIFTGIVNAFRGMAVGDQNLVVKG